MKHRIISAFPVVFSLTANSDYSRFVIASHPSDAMRNNWVGLGKRLQQAATQVNNDAKEVTPSPASK